MLRGIWGDPERFRETYWSKWTGKTVDAGGAAQPGESVYFPGDGAKRDERGYFWVIGRIDDVLNVAGHRIGTMEVESALVDHPSVAEAAVVGKAHELKGQAVAAFVTLKEGQEPTEELKKELSEHVVRKIGAIARPDAILFAGDLPKTRSARSCAASSRTSPRAGRWATPPRSPTPTWCSGSRGSTRRRRGSRSARAKDRNSGSAPGGSRPAVVGDFPERRTERRREISAPCPSTFIRGRESNAGLEIQPPSGSSFAYPPLHLSRPVT
jgi:hypothetical protein